MTRVILLAAAVMAIALTGGPVTADEPYNAQVLGIPTGSSSLTSWTYTVTNTSPSPDYTIWLVQIEVDEGTKVVSALGPSGWATMYEPGTESYVMWFCTSADLPVGESLGGFRANFDSEPAYQSWTAQFNNTQNPGENPVGFGSVLTPEPGGIAAMLMGLAPFAWLTLRRRA